MPGCKGTDINCLLCLYLLVLRERKLTLTATPEDNKTCCTLHMCIQEHDCVSLQLQLGPPPVTTLGVVPAHNKSVNTHCVTD